MRGLTLLAIGGAALLSMGATGAFADEMNADEILQRLKKQAASVGTLTVDPNATTRGMKLNYGTDEPEPAAAPSAVAIPAQPAPGVAVETGPSIAVAPATAEPTFERVTVPDVGLAAIPEAVAPSIATTETESVSIETLPVPAAPAATTPSVTYGTVATTDPVVEPTVRLSAASPDPEDYQAVEEEARVDLRIYFEWNSAALRPDAIGQLSQLCTAIQSMTQEGSRQFKIIGHTDKSGSSDYNLYLSEARAREVKRHLIEECSLSEDALIATGEGERQSSPNSPSLAPEERRVEVQLVS